MTAGALSPLATAQADPLDPDTDIVVDVTPGADADVAAPDTAETSDDTTDSSAPTEDSLEATAAPEANTIDTANNSPDVGTTQNDAADVGVAEEADVVAPEALSDVVINARATTSAAVPLTAEAAAIDTSGLTSMRLRKSNGYWVTITPAMQRNALVVIDTIKAASWAGVTANEKDRLIVIALMTMAQESTFYTHPYAHVPDANQDVGPFQQRSKVGWYADGKTQAENVKILNNIPYATLTFIQGHRVPKWVPGAAGPTGYIIPGVFQMRNWRTDPYWQVAANVQRPATQYRYHYEYWRPVVQDMVKALKEYSDPVDVYTTAGQHTVNGREWKTTCGPYSTTIRRCTANIWATTVSLVDGKFVQKNDWQFNNLTYLPSKRAQWSGNLLAKTGTFTSNGRQWRTSCADSWTGPNGCRSFMRADVIESYLDADGNRQFRSVRKEVFNNVVRFSD